LVPPASVACVGVAIVLVFCGIIAGLIGGRKGMPVLSILAGLMIGPFGIILVYFARGDRVDCRFCDTLISPNATICPQCQREQPISQPGSDYWSSIGQMGSDWWSSLDGFRRAAYLLAGVVLLILLSHVVCR
jgi:hypothetical protein